MTGGSTHKHTQTTAYECPPQVQMKGSVKKGDLFLISQKVKGQQSIFVVKQAIMGEVQQLYH